MRLFDRTKKIFIMELTLPRGERATNSTDLATGLTSIRTHELFFDEALIARGKLQLPPTISQGRIPDEKHFPNRLL